MEDLDHGEQASENDEQTRPGNIPNPVQPAGHSRKLDIVQAQRAGERDKRIENDDRDDSGDDESNPE